MSTLFNRRSLLRGALGGGAVVMGLPALDMFLDGNGMAYADGAKLPTRFGTYFWGLGLTDTAAGTRWVPSKIGADYEITPELESIRALKHKVSVLSGFRVIGDGRPNIVHWSGHASILSGVSPQVDKKFDGPSFDTTISDALSTGSRFKALHVSANGKTVSYSTRTGASFATPETSPIELYTRLFGDGFQDPNSDNWKPDPTIMLRQSILSAVKDQRAALMAGVGRADQIKMDQYFSSIRELENQLALGLQRPEKCEACVVPTSPEDKARSTAVDVINANTKAMGKLLAMGLACNQTKVFNFVHTPGSSDTYEAGTSKTYHQITHDEPTDAKLGYQPETSKLAGMVMAAFGDFLTEMDAIKEGDGTLLDRSLIFGFSDTGYAKIHSIDNIPMLIAGGANGRHKAGQHIATKGDPVTRASLTAIQLAGVSTGEFGQGAMKTSRPISELMA